MTTRRRAFALTATGLVAGLLTAGSEVALGHGGVTSDPHGGATIAERFKIHTKGPSKVFTTHVRLEPSAHTGWHTHPGPHIVHVKGATLRVYSLDCAAFTDYAPGTGFVVDDADFVHAARNLSSTDTLELVVTDIREDEQPPTINVDPQPSHVCLSAAPT